MSRSSGRILLKEKVHFFCRLDGRNHRAGSTGGTRHGHGSREQERSLSRWRRLGSKGQARPCDRWGKRGESTSGWGERKSPRWRVIQLHAGDAPGQRDATGERSVSLAKMPGSTRTACGQRSDALLCCCLAFFLTLGTVPPSIFPMRMTHAM